MSSEFAVPASLANLPLSRHAHDRDYVSRARPDLFEHLWADAATRVLVLRNGSALLADGHTALAFLAPADVPDAELLLFLGRSLEPESTAYVAAVLSDDAASGLGGETAWGSLRELGSRLSDLETGLFTEALGLANWHDTDRFSPTSGHPTSPALGGWVRRSGTDDRDVFPRTDAAIIVGVVDGQDRILLGSNALWAENRYSLLAGFVEPGESLESAVVREVFEEAGIVVFDPVYLGSQPWPFPASLMVGFRASVDDAQAAALEPDGEEIVDLRWFSRESLAESLDEIALPGPTSIARAILEDWFGGPIDDRREW